MKFCLIFHFKLKLCILQDNQLPMGILCTDGSAYDTPRRLSDFTGHPVPDGNNIL